MILEAITTLLKAGGIDNVYPVIIPQEEKPPFGVMFIVSDEPNPAKKEVSPINHVNIQISVYADSYTQATEFDESIRSILDDYDGIVNGVDMAIDYDGSTDLYESDTRLYHKATDYLILKK